MGYKFFINDDKNTVLITLNDEKYKTVVAKVGHIAKNDNDEIEFDMELPENCKEYYEDAEFTEQISLAVGDIVTKAINQVWSENVQEVLSLLENKTLEYFTKYNYIPPEGETFISLFGKKGFVISEDDDGRLTAINLKNNKTYYFDDNKQLGYLKKVITGSEIIVSA